MDNFEVTFQPMILRHVKKESCLILDKGSPNLDPSTKQSGNQKPFVF